MTYRGRSALPEDEVSSLLALQEPLYACQFRPDTCSAVLGKQAVYVLIEWLSFRASEFHEPLLCPPPILQGYPIDLLLRLRRQSSGEGFGQLAASPGL